MTVIRINAIEVAENMGPELAQRFAARAHAVDAADGFEGFELLQVHNAMPRGGRVIATAIIRERAVSELEAEGADYAAARDALRAKVPEGRRLLNIVVD